MEKSTRTTGGEFVTRWNSLLAKNNNRVGGSSEELKPGQDSWYLIQSVNIKHNYFLLSSPLCIPPLVVTIAKINPNMKGVQAE